MIVGVEGVLEAIGDDFVVVGVGGISFKVSTSASTLAKLPAVGERVRLHTHLYLREDALALYGFRTRDELEIFELLLTVSGVGPRLALALLSGLSVDRVRSALASGDADALRVPGVGKKLAERLVLELKGKVPASSAIGVARPSTDQAEVRAALSALGYSMPEITAALAALPDASDLSVEERIRLALRQLAKR